MKRIRKGYNLERNADLLILKDKYNWIKSHIRCGILVYCYMDGEEPFIVTDIFSSKSGNIFTLSHSSGKNICINNATLYACSCNTNNVSIFDNSNSTNSQKFISECAFC